MSTTTPQQPTDSQSVEAPLDPQYSVLVVLPTLAKSPLLPEALAAITRQRTDLDLRLVVVSQGALGAEDAALIENAADYHLALTRPVGFAAANNAALRGSAPGLGPLPPFIALINDDAIIEDGWFIRLRAALEAQPRAAAAQGLNLVYGRGEHQPLVDGAGLHWNRRLQAVQIGYGSSPERYRSPTVAIYGVSATAALFRTTAVLEAMPLAMPQAMPKAGTTDPRRDSDNEPTPILFDEALDTYYEDVDLACRLRDLDWQALLVPAARCRHAASSSAPRNRASLLVGNRHLVLARHLGRGYWTQVPRLMILDLLHFGAAAFGGWARAATRLRKFASRRRPSQLHAEGES